MNGGNEGPDKRTTAYENIFGRPTAKPKGPNHAYPSVNGIAPNLAAVNQWANQTAYLANQQQTPRYNGINPAVGSSQPYRGPQQVYGYGPHLGQPNMQPDMIDRRASMAPSMSSHDPRMSSYFGATGSAADAYGGEGLSNLTGGGGGYYQQPTAPYHRSNPSPAPGPRPLPPIQGQHLEGGSYRQRQPSNSNLPPYVRQPSIPASSPPPGEDNALPLRSVPRLPSFDLGAGKSANDEHWFANGNGNGNGYANAGNRISSTSAVSPTLPQEENPVSPDLQSMTLYSESTDKEDTAIGDEGMYRNGE